MAPSELAQMQQEWRENVTKSIQTTNEKLDSVLEKLAGMDAACAKLSALEVQAHRIDVLERDKQRVIGAFVVLNVIGGFVVWLAHKMWPS